MKSVAILFALLVAVLLFTPTPASGAALPAPEGLVQQSAVEQETADDAVAGNEAADDAAADDAVADDAVTPTEEAEDASGIVDLHATAARLRGRVELGWSVNEQVSEGVFIVERSTNGSFWRSVKACSQRFEGTESDFGCTDTRLTSGTTYAYRVCITSKGTTCSNASPSQPVMVKAP